MLYRGATAHRSAACRFTPSCSQYALEAVENFGARRSVPLILRRLARCRPGGPFGYDPVPEAGTPPDQSSAALTATALASEDEPSAAFRRTSQ